MAGHDEAVGTPSPQPQPQPPSRSARRAAADRPRRQRRRLLLLDAAATASGRSRFFCQLAGIARGLGFEVVLASPTRLPRQRAYPCPADVVEVHLAVRSGGPGIRWTPTRDAFVDPDAFAREVSLADVVIAPATLDAAVADAMGAALRGSARSLVSDHTGLRLVGRLDAEQVAQHAHWVRSVDAVHAVTEGLAECARAAGARVVHVITPAVDAGAFVGSARVWGERLWRRPQAMLVPGALTAEKQPDVALDAFARLLRARPGWRLDIVGDGPTREDLEARAADLGLGDRVRVTGFDPHLPRHMRRYPIVASASAFEALPTVLLEAQAAGCVAVFPASAGGPRWLVRDGVDGVLASDDGVEAMAVALLRAVDLASGDPRALRALQRAATKVARRAHPSTVGDAWAEVLTT